MSVKQASILFEPLSVKANLQNQLVIQIAFYRSKCSYIQKDDKTRETQKIKFNDSSKMTFPNQQPLKLHSNLIFKEQINNCDSKVFNVQVISKLDSQKYNVNKQIDVKAYYGKGKQIHVLRVSQSPVIELLYRVHIYFKEVMEKKRQSKMQDVPHFGDGQNTHQKKQRSKSTRQNNHLRNKENGYQSTKIIKFQNQQKSIHNQSQSPVHSPRNKKHYKTVVIDNEVSKDVQQKHSRHQYMTQNNNIIEKMHYQSKSDNFNQSQKKSDSFEKKTENDKKITDFEKIQKKTAHQIELNNIKYSELQKKYTELEYRYKKLQKKYTSERSQNKEKQYAQSLQLQQKYKKVKQELQIALKKQSDYSRMLDKMDRQNVAALKKHSQKLEDSNAKNKKLERQILSLKEQNKDLEQKFLSSQQTNVKLGDKDESIKKFQETLKTYKDRIKHLERQLDSLQEDKNYQEKECTKIKQQTIDLKAKVKALNEQNLKHLQLISEKEYEIQKVSLKIQQLERQSSDNRVGRQPPYEDDSEISHFKTQKKLGTNGTSSLNKLKQENTELKSKLSIISRNLENKEQLLKKFDQFSKEGQREKDLEIAELKGELHCLRQKGIGKLERKSSFDQIKTNFELQSLKESLQYKSSMANKLLTAKAQLQKENKHISEQIVKSKQIIVDILNVLQNCKDDHNKEKVNVQDLIDDLIEDANACIM